MANKKENQNQAALFPSLWEKANKGNISSKQDIYFRGLFLWIRRPWDMKWWPICNKQIITLVVTSTLSQLSFWNTIVFWSIPETS